MTLTMASSPTVTTSSSTLHTTKLCFAKSPLLQITTNTFFLSKTLFKPKKLCHITTTTKALETHISSTFHYTFNRCCCSSLDSLEVVVEDPKPETSEQDEQEQQQQQPEIVEETSDEGRLYVGNLPRNMTDLELSELFAKAGRVANVEVIYGRAKDKNRGFGFVTMGSDEEANEAIRMFDGAEIEGLTLKVNFPEVPRRVDGEVMRPKRNRNKRFVESQNKIYAGNLGWRLTSQGLKEAFGDQRGLLSATVIYNRETGRSRGFGFVSFESQEDAEAALEAMNGVDVEGRPLRLNVASDRARPPEGRESSTGSNTENTKLLSADT